MRLGARAFLEKCIAEGLGANVETERVTHAVQEAPSSLIAPARSSRTSG